MKIDFENMKNTALNDPGANAAARTASYGKTDARGSIGNAERSGAGFAVDLSRRQEGVGEYSRQKKDLSDMIKDAGKDISGVTDKMLICASTMSGEDYAKMVKDGVDPARCEVADTVTILDRIKTVMARSGAVVEGFNGSGDLDMDTLTQITGSRSYAGSIARAFEKEDLPLDEGSAKEIAAGLDKLDQIDEISDGMKQYLLENRMEPTIDNLYIARFSAGKMPVASGGYFADDQQGYIGRSGGVLDDAGILSMNDSIERVIEEAGLSDDPGAKDRCLFLLDAGIPISEDNLTRLTYLESIELPVERAKAIEYMTDAVAEGKRAGDADLSGRGTYTLAKKIYEETNAVSDEALDMTLASGRAFTIKELSASQRSIEAGMRQDADSKGPAADGGYDELITARRTFAEVRLTMTVRANMSLLSSGFSIDTAEMSRLVDELKAEEQKSDLTWGLSAADKADTAVFDQTMTERSDLFEMPAALMGKIGEGALRLSFHELHEEGKVLADTYLAAGERYETMMTLPRSDLGDSLKKAFGNIDEILKDMNLSASEDNQRAVRMLVYNHMEITDENIESVRFADRTVRSVLEKMNPPAVLKMIRDGVNPLEKTMQELSDYFDSQSLEKGKAADKFSSFLYRLEQADSVTEDERDAYMGIYRLLHQIEKGDGGAIGWVVNNNREMTFDNLLTGLRSLKKGRVSLSAGEDIPVTSSKVQKSISAQINSYYGKAAADILDKGLDPAGLKEAGITLSSTLDELIDAQIIEDLKTSGELAREACSDIRDSYNAPANTVRLLLENGIEITPDNLKAADGIIHDRGRTLRDIKKIHSKMTADSGAGTGGDNPYIDNELTLPDIDALIDMPLAGFEDYESVQDAYAKMTEGIGDMIEQSISAGPDEYLDIRTLSQSFKQLNLMRRMGKEENYELPAVIDGFLTSVNVTFRHDKTKPAMADINVLTADQKNIRASIRIREDGISLIAAADDKELRDRIELKLKAFDQKILDETGKAADISIIQTGAQINQTQSNTGLPGNEENVNEHSPAILYKAAKLFITELSQF